MTGTSSPLSLTGGTVVTPTRSLSDGILTIVGDCIEAIDTPSRPLSMVDTIDVSGQYVLPGFVDVHGDDIERYLSPRPEERIPVPDALRQSERAALAAGVTTKFHALAYEDAPDHDRTIERARRLTEAVRDRRETAAIDARVHARCELGDGASVGAATDALRAGFVDLVSLMHHGPDRGQYVSAEGFSNRHGTPSQADAAESDAAETGTDDGLEAVVRSRAAVPNHVLDRRRDTVVEAARTAGVTIASHDDADAATVDRAANRGVDVCEFPLTMGAARRATARGLTDAMGAPNLVRGGSLWENLAVEDAVDADAVDVLCSDFRPGTLLASVFTETGEPLHARVNRVTAAPADAVGLAERGRLEPGARADIVVVDPDPTPTVSRAFVAGREVYRFDTDA